MNDQQQIDEIFQRIAGDLSMIADRELKVQHAEVQRTTARVAGAKLVHISFKLGFEHAGQITHGSLLIPLPDSIALACYLMMMPDDGVKSKRNLSSFDSGTKDAMLEIGNFIGGAADAALRSIGLDDIRVRSESCQGVKANVRPAFVYDEGTPLIVGRAKAQLHSWPAFEMILMLPVLEPASVSSSAAA
ncbi:MAG: hypothetical protein IPJ19_02860 [Planctomycetes bacterium]|nr:hypothetical protein [Planctomycetota bacterium]